ncbi:TPA: hypothetical protein R2K55_005772 [Raoultella ornithinolytica]|uniref:hypothetical protein n=1 Tax=Raoultella ornithinolytica TaxID=54291 RepID=UPI00273D7E26|nr:hypothetical protein [Raoultella ornithinolytica]WLP46281.1 hypothetical protein Q7A27_00250 [Raoultella ornithinolytica]HEC2553937.1 hypothetical protein [Raoultella ornithinolytica]HEC2606742.1 hypothetical protein [Raoultella ornithinolytica]HEC2611322.1 hypothetical protein [Raoultella ornithinolytica]
MSVHSRQIGIVWEERFPDLRPGVLYFECERLSAHLTKESCHQNWTAAHEKVTDETPLRLLKCRSCPMGRALHTDGDTSLTWQDVRSGSECVRCGRRDLRLIGGTTCVSCWNREREGRTGFDARGNVPRTRVVLHPRRVGLVGKDGKPTWYQFNAYHEGEAISRAVRQTNGVKFHDLQPGKSVWNTRVKRWQYRCDKHNGEFGTLRELVGENGSILYVCPVCRPGAAKGLSDAQVCSATSLSSPGFVKDMLATKGIIGELTEHYAPTAHICDRCRHYAIEVRLRAGKVDTRCPMCDGE